MEKFKLKETIVSERLLILKRQHEHDAEMWEAIEESRDFIREYLFWVDKTQSLKDVIKSTDMFFKKWDDDEEWCYDIYSRDENKLLGSIGVHNIQFMNQSAELGYWLRKSETKKGYMTEAVLAVEKELFEEGMHRVTICCDVNNVNSAHVALRAGYTLEGIQKEAMYHYTGLHDHATYVKFSPYPIQGF